MGPESCTPSSSPGGKRSRDPEDEVYLDNLRSHKRYLSEIMASSLNGLTVGDTLPDNLLESPARSESIFYSRDDISLQYSPMSEDSDEPRYYEASINTCSTQPDSMPTSPVSPYRSQRTLGGFCISPSTSSQVCAITAAASPQPRQRGSDSESRFPSSPSDICHSADLRRAALLRSVQMRTQPAGPSAFELPLSPGIESVPNVEAEEQPCSYMKSSADEREYQIEDCSPMGALEPEYNQEKTCRASEMHGKRGDSLHDVETKERQHSYMRSLVNERVYQIEDCSPIRMSEPEFNQEQSCKALDMSTKEEPGD